MSTNETRWDLLIAKAITTEGYDDCIASLANERAKKYISDIAGVEPHGTDSSSSDGGNDPEHPTPISNKPSKPSPIISTIDPPNKDNDASETTPSAKHEEDQENDKTSTDNRSRGMVGDDSKDDTPHQNTCPPVTTSLSDEENKSRIATKLRLGAAQAETPSNDIDHEHLLDAAIQEIAITLNEYTPCETELNMPGPNPNPTLTHEYCRTPAPFRAITLNEYTPCETERNVTLDQVSIACAEYCECAMILVCGVFAFN